MTSDHFLGTKHNLIAILRGLEPDEAEAVVAGLIDAGIMAIEIPLNSPNPFRSIEIASRIAPSDCLIGAGTILAVEDVQRVCSAGGRLAVSPNVDPDVIRTARSKGMIVLPGAFTATEALSALKAGATGIKFFPADLLGPAGITAIRTILPQNTLVAAVGGISEDSFAAYVRAGITVFGLGSSLYRRGMAAPEVARRGKAALQEYRRAIAEAA